MAWTVELDFDDGNGWRDITDRVEVKTLRRKRSLWNKDLKPTTNTCSFQMYRDTTIINLLLSTDGEIKVRIQEDASNWFVGLVRPNFRVTSGTQLGPTKIECVDYSAYWLKKKIDTTFEWEDYDVIDTTTTAESIVHQLLTKAGYTSDEWSLSGDIAETIDYYVHVAGESKKTYWEALTEILFEFGYVWDHDEDGKFYVYNFLPADTSTSDDFTDVSPDNNMIGQLKIEKQLADYEAVEIQWWSHKTVNNAFVFEERTGGDAIRKCNINVAAGSYYPDGSDSTPYYAEFRYGDKEIVRVGSAELILVGQTNIAQHTFTAAARRAQLSVENSGPTAEVIYRLDILGDVTYKDILSKTRREEVADTEQILEVEAKFITNSTDATKLANGLSRHFKYGDFRYTVRSKETYSLGGFVDVVESNLSIDNRTVIVEIEDIDVRTGEQRFTCEGITDYSGNAVDEDTLSVPSGPSRGRSVALIGASDYAGEVDRRCDGTDDEDDINAELGESQKVELSEGTFEVETAEIAPGSNNILVGRGKSTIIEKNLNDYALEILGTTGTYLEDISIEDLKITRNSSDTNGIELMHIKYAKRVVLENVMLDDSYGNGLLIEYCESMVLIKVTINGAEVDGLILKQTLQVTILASFILACGGIGCKLISDDATDIMDRGNCEETTEPMVSGETVAYTGNALWARDSGQAHNGSYSYKYTHNHATVASIVCFTDGVSGTDLHGATPGNIYRLGVWIYIPSSGGPLSSEIFLTHYYSMDRSMPNLVSNVNAQPIYDEWQYIEIALRLPIGATAWYCRFSVSADATLGECFYVDDVVLYETIHENNGYVVESTTIKGNGKEGIFLATSQARIVNCPAIENNKGGGIKLAGGEDNYIFANSVRDNGNLILYADCENDDQAPAVEDDGSSTSNASFARDSGQAYKGTYSHKHTITAGGTDSEARLVDSAATDDLHELLAGKTYEFSGYVYIPSTGGPQASEVSIVLKYYDDSSWTEKEVFATGQDAWEEVTTGEVAIPSTATAAMVLVRIASAAASSEYCYWDEFWLKPIGIHNEHEQNFQDNGVNTQIGQNSWQGVSA